MSKRFKIELAYSLHAVGVRVVAQAHDWVTTSTTVDIKLTGSLSPDDAIAFADALRAKAEKVKTKNAKRDAQEQRLRERSPKLPRTPQR